MGKDSADLTPEKQLLKLIEDPHAASPKTAAARSGGLSSLSLGVLEGRFSFLKKRFFSFSKSWEGPLDIKKINGLLTAMAAMVGICFAVSSLLLANRLSSLPVFSFKKGGSGKIEALKNVPQLKAIAYYLEKVRSRDIFKFGKTETHEASVPKENAAAAQQEAVSSRYKLVGISWSDNPDAMIEDTTAQKTYFLKRGQAIDNIKIQAIFKDKVVLNAGGQEVELR